MCESVHIQCVFRSDSADIVALLFRTSDQGKWGKAVLAFWNVLVYCVLQWVVKKKKECNLVSHFRKKNIQCRKTAHVYGNVTIQISSCCVTVNCHCKTNNCEIPEVCIHPLRPAELRAFWTGHMDMSRSYLSRVRKRMWEEGIYIFHLFTFFLMLRAY